MPLVACAAWPRRQRRHPRAKSMYTASQRLPAVDLLLARDEHGLAFQRVRRRIERDLGEIYRDRIDRIERPVQFHRQSHYIQWSYSVNDRWVWVQFRGLEDD